MKIKTVVNYLRSRAEDLNSQVLVSRIALRNVLGEFDRQEARLAVYEAADYFVCPNCGGHYFGRDTSRVDGIVFVSDTVRCHDQHKTKCKWRGVWPVKGETTDG